MSDPCRKGPCFHGESVCFYSALLVCSSILTSVQASAASPPSSNIVVVLTLRLPRLTTYTRFHPPPFFLVFQRICYHPHNSHHPDLGPIFSHFLHSRRVRGLLHVVVIPIYRL